MKSLRIGLAPPLGTMPSTVRIILTKSMSCFQKLSHGTTPRVRIVVDVVAAQVLRVGQRRRRRRHPGLSDAPGRLRREPEHGDQGRGRRHLGAGRDAGGIGEDRGERERNIGGGGGRGRRMSRHSAPRRSLRWRRRWGMPARLRLEEAVRLVAVAVAHLPPSSRAVAVFAPHGSPTSRVGHARRGRRRRSTSPPQPSSVRCHGSRIAP